MRHNYPYLKISNASSQDMNNIFLGYNVALIWTKWLISVTLDINKWKRNGNAYARENRVFLPLLALISSSDSHSQSL